MSERTEQEVEEVLDKVSEATENGSIYPGMSYEDGVRAAIEWLLHDEPSPFE